MKKWTSKFKVARFKCALSYSEGDHTMYVKWYPHLPKALSDQAWGQYEAGRDALLARVFQSKTGVSEPQDD